MLSALLLNNSEKDSSNSQKNHRIRRNQQISYNIIVSATAESAFQCAQYATRLLRGPPKRHWVESIKIKNFIEVKNLKSLKMIVHCPICSEILLPSDVLYSTPCGHIFHDACLSRWISKWADCDFHFLCLFLSTTQIPSNFDPKIFSPFASNTTCPQCRQECSSSTNHRIYLPEVNFQDQDSLVERMNEINRQKLEFEGKLKKIEDEKKGLELQLKKKKQEFHRVLQRQMKRSKSEICDDFWRHNCAIICSPLPFMCQAHRTFHLVTIKVRQPVSP